MLKVAVTGGIGTGKSVVLARVRRVRGAGRRCRRARRTTRCAPGTPAAAEIRARFGDARHRRRRRRGSDAPRGRSSSRTTAARRDLEAILHPAVYRAIAAVDGRRSGATARPLAVAEIPLLFETGHEARLRLRRRDRVRRRGAGAADRRPVRHERRRTPAGASRRSGRWPRRCAARTTSSAPTAPLDDTRRQARAVWDALMPAC